MLRFVFLLIFITIISLGMAFVADQPGHISIDWSEFHIETSVLVILVVTGLISLAFILLYMILMLLVRSPRAWMRSRLAKRQALGLAALTEAYAAIATQDIANAKRQIALAQKHIPHQPLTLMFSAQVARLEGNESQARLHLEKMLSSETTEFMAMRGLIENARRNHQYAKALELAERAIALRPKDEWLITLLSALYSSQERSQDALRLLEFSKRKRYIDKILMKKLSTYVLYESAQLLMQRKRPESAIRLLEECLTYMPQFTPASALLAKAYSQNKDIKRALKVIYNSWKISANPLLTEALLAVYSMEEDGKKSTYMAEKMAHFHSESDESRFLLAAIALKRRDHALARKHIQGLVQTHESSRVCQMMAQCSSAANDHEEAAEWLRRATAAPVEPVFSCGNCQHPKDIWEFICSHCGSVGTIS